jgi:hypothetical protein
MHEERIHRMLDKLANAVSSGDVKAISSCWSFPALFLSDAGATVINAAAEVEYFMAQANEAYRAQGIVSTRPEVERIDILTDGTAAVDVGWPGFDQAGQRRSNERSHYIAQLGSDGEARIRVAMTRTK